MRYVEFKCKGIYDRFETFISTPARKKSLKNQQRPEGILNQKEWHTMSAKLKEINWETFEILCKLQCTQSEIASSLNISVDTLERRVPKEYQFSLAEAYKKFSEGGKCSLRRYQFKQAEKSCAMAIWLGKQYLGQRDLTDEIKVSPNQNFNDAMHENMLLKNKIRELEETIANKCQTGSEFCGSHASI